MGARAMQGEWLLRAAERGNPRSVFEREGRPPWTEGNAARVLIDGAEYFQRLHTELCDTRVGEWVYFTDWEGDADELLDGPGTEIGQTFVDLATRGVNVRGLLWRSHAKAIGFSEGDNRDLARLINEAGGEVLLDQRVRRGGSHHQKIVVVRRSDPHDDVAFLGGIDLCHGRHDDNKHRGDPQCAELDDDRYGDRPPWHDVQIELRGPVVDDVIETFRERWNDPTPLDTPAPWRRVLHRVATEPREPSGLAPPRPIPVQGHCVAQVLRTYPAVRRSYPFATRGERSIARAYAKAFSRAKRLIYIEDQYLWSSHATGLLLDALVSEPALRLVLVVPRYPDPDGRIAGGASRLGRERVLDALSRVSRERVGVYDLENEAGSPIYVHSKVCIVDDVWLAVGSDNLNRRSWTHDSEISCALIDDRADSREPTDPAGLGDGARDLARSTRLRLACEHLGRASDDLAGLLDLHDFFDATRAAAARLDDWHAADKAGPRPPGHVRAHPTERVSPVERLALGWVQTHVLDPDGRPRSLKRRDAF